MLRPRCLEERTTICTRDWKENRSLSHFSERLRAGPRTDGATRKGRDRDDGPREMKNERKRHCVHQLAPSSSILCRSLVNPRRMLGSVPSVDTTGNQSRSRTGTYLGRASTIVLLLLSNIFLSVSPSRVISAICALISFFLSLSLFFCRIDPPRD